MNPPMMVRTPIGQCRTTMFVRNTTVKIEGIEFLVSPILLKSSTIDLILGMDWLKIHDAALYCGNKSVQLFHPSGEIEGIEFLVSPILLKSSTIDLILGMDWGNK